MLSGQVAGGVEPAQLVDLAAVMDGFERDLAGLAPLTQDDGLSDDQRALHRALGVYRSP